MTGFRRSIGCWSDEGQRGFGKSRGAEVREVEENEGRREKKVLWIRVLGDTEEFVLHSGRDGLDGAGETMGLFRLQEALRRRRPDVVVLDLEIPIHRGVELLRSVTEICPQAELLTRLELPNLEPRFFAVQSSGLGLSLAPLAADALAGILTWRACPARRSGPIRETG